MALWAVSFIVMFVSLVAIIAVLPSGRPLDIGTKFGDGWGVNIHFTREKPGEVRQIASAGFKWVRMNFYWAYVEERANQYRFSAYDELMEDLDRHRIRPIFTLSFENPIHGNSAPRTPEQREAFSRFVRASLLHFKGRGIVWELWNEPNHPPFWKPAPNVSEYIQLTKSVGRAFRETAPDEPLIGPSTSGFDWPYLAAIVGSGAHEEFTALSVHPYRQENPETVLADWQRLRQMLDRSGAVGSQMPMICSEWGYSETYKNMSETAQAQMAVRAYLSNLAAGVPLTIHYSWKNEMWQSKEEARRFGTVDDSLRPKAAYRAIQQAGRELSGYEFLGRIETGAHVFALVFRRNDEFKIAGWSTIPLASLKLGREEYQLSPTPRFFLADAASLGQRASAKKAKTRHRQPIDWFRIW